MEIVMRIEGEDDDEFEWIAEEKAGTNVTSPVKTVYRENENVVHIQNMSFNWEALAIDMYGVNSRNVTLQDMDVKKKDVYSNVVC